MPKYYYVPTGNVETERGEPGSTNLEVSGEDDENIFLWGQSVYIISQLLGMYELLFISFLDTDLVLKLH